MKTSPISKILSLIVATILLQTLYFKFTAAPESVYIFTTIGMEPWGRIGIGIMELITGVLLLYRPTRAVGALLSLGVISGAIFFHLTILGIVVQQDGGLLFGLGMTVFILSVVLLRIHFSELPIDTIRDTLKPRNPSVQ